MLGTTLPVPPAALALGSPNPSATIQAPINPRALSAALLGLLALGAAAGLGSAGFSPGLRLIPSVLLIELATLALGAPALIAIHQFMGLAAAPEALAAALGRALIHAGRVAAGLALIVLFFGATTSLATPMLLIALAGVGVFTSVTACVELRAAERHAATVVPPVFSLLLIAWLGLSWLIALRVGVNVAVWVFDFGGGVW